MSVRCRLIYRPNFTVSSKQPRDIGTSHTIIRMKKPRSREHRSRVHLLMPFWLASMLPGLGLLPMTNHFPGGLRPTFC